MTHQINAVGLAKVKDFYLSHHISGKALTSRGMMYCWSAHIERLLDEGKAPTLTIKKETSNDRKPKTLNLPSECFDFISNGTT